MQQDHNAAFGPKTVRRMREAYRYAHNLYEQRMTGGELKTEVKRDLAVGIVECAKQDKRLLRRAVRSVVSKVVGKQV